MKVYPMKLCLLVLALFCTAPSVAAAPTPKEPLMDERAVKLGRFFDHYHCPQINYSLIDDYLTSADKHNLAYNLLPAISIQESTCGRHQLYNNWWGFWSDAKGFKSVSEGIDFVSNQLANGFYYKGKSLDQILKAYNSNPEYAPKIKGFMKQIEQ